MEYNSINNFLNSGIKLRQISPYSRQRDTDRLYSSVQRINKQKLSLTPRANRNSSPFSYTKPTIDSNTFSKLHKKINHLEQQYESISKSNTTDYKPVTLKTSRQSTRQENYQGKKYSRQQTKKYLETMIRIVEGQIDALTERIHQFQYRIQNHVQRQFNILKKTIVESIQSIFNNIKQSFTKQYQKRILHLNSPLFTTKDQLSNLSHKLHKIRQNIQAPHWSSSVTGLDTTRMSEQVQMLVERSQKLQTQKLIIEIQKQSLRALDQSVRDMLQLNGNLRAVRDR